MQAGQGGNRSLSTRPLSSERPLLASHSHLLHTPAYQLLTNVRFRPKAAVKPGPNTYIPNVRFRESSHSPPVAECQVCAFFFGVITRPTRPRLCSLRSFNWVTISSTAAVTAL